MPSFISLDNIPNRKSEFWRYTRLSGIFQKQMDMYGGAFDTHNYSTPKVKDWPGPCLIIHNNSIVESASRLEHISWRNEAVAEESVHALPVQKDNFVDTILVKSNTPQLHIKIAKPSTGPILILHDLPTQVRSQAELVVHRVHIEIAENCEAQVVHGFRGGSTDVVPVIEIVERVSESAKLDTYILRELSFESNLFIKHRVQQEADSSFSGFVGVFSRQALTRYELTAVVQGEDTRTQLKGLYLVKESAQSDFVTHLDHLSAGQVSSQNYRGVLDNEARALFRGLIHIHEHCPGTVTAQINQNIILSSKAEIDTLPQLQIDTDDVKATHGATVGQLQLEELFYLQSRGISKDQAQRMVIDGFCKSVLEDLPAGHVRGVIANRVAEWQK